MRKYMFPIAVVAGLLLTGCVVMHQGRSGEKAASDAADGGSYTGSYEQQIDLILANKEVWRYSLPEDVTEPEEMFVTEADYAYFLSDLDQNGRLEVVSSTTTGNGSVFSNTYYEVSEDGRGLIKLRKATLDRGEVPEPDLWNFSVAVRGYYDREAGIYHYPQWDHTHSSAADTEDAREDLFLSDGVVTVNTVCGSRSRAAGKGCIVTYYAGAGTEKLGETGYIYKKDWEAENPKKARRYEKKLERIGQQYYEGMEEFTVTLKWFDSFNKKAYYDSGKIRAVSDEKLRERMKKSWDSFGINIH